MLLAGNPPFNGKTPKDIILKIKKGVVDYANPRWSKISNEAICLLKKMLISNPELRISASEALRDSWIIKFLQKKNCPEISECIKNLENFKAASVLEKAVFTYIGIRTMDKVTEEKLKKAFYTIDTDHNGTLSLDELTQCCMILYNGNENIANEKAQKIMSTIDVNGNGTIDYNGKFNLVLEFLMANVSYKDCSDDYNLKIAFDFFDKDHNGSISIDELKSVFMGEGGDEEISKIMRMADSNNDGEVCFMLYNRSHLMNSK